MKSTSVHGLRLLVALLVVLVHGGVGLNTKPIARDVSSNSTSLLHQARASFLSSIRIQRVQSGKSFVFFLGLQKAGTTSFAFFMADVMRMRALHASDAFYRIIDFQNDGPKSCNGINVGPKKPSWQPDYEAVLRELDPSKVESFLDQTGFQAMADHPWPLLFQWLDETYPDSKFVFWDRDSSSWAKSAKKFFSRDKKPHPRRMMMLDYGACHIEDVSEHQLKKVYEGHTKAVRSYFVGADAPVSRQSRFLEFNLDGPTAAKDLCEFLDTDVSCAGMGYMPRKNKISPPKLVDLNHAAVSNSSWIDESSMMQALEAAVLEPDNCTGDGPVPTDVCYSGETMGETVRVKVSTYDNTSGNGTVMFGGRGLASITCNKPFVTSSEGGTKTVSISGMDTCVPSVLTVVGMKYCSDQDKAILEGQVSFMSAELVLQRTSCWQKSHRHLVASS